jgi:hypothetical protein
MRDRRTIKVDDPARMMDFEQFAEAGCRAMGFAKDEFVDAYAANRRGSMAMAAEASAVGRAVMDFLRVNRRGFAGQMSGLLQALQSHKGDAHWRDWPKDPTRLSTELRRLTKPLSAINIICATSVDRRSEKGGTQHDVIVKYADAK